MSNELRKMLAGKAYDPLDAELVAARTRARSFFPESESARAPSSERAAW